MAVPQVPGRPVPTKDTLNRLPKKRLRQQGQLLVQQELKEHDYYGEYMSNFPALASGSQTPMSMF